MKTALIKTTTASQSDCSNMSTATGIEIVSTEPAGTAARYAVSVAGGTWKKFNTSTNAWVDVTTQALTETSLLSEGNTKAELMALGSTYLANFIGKKIDFAAALSMEDSATISPTLTKIKVNGQTGSTVYTTTMTSDTINLSSTDNAVEILAIDVTKTELNGGTVTVNASIQNTEGAWGSFVPYAGLVTTPATVAKAIKFQAILTAPTPGTSSASLSSVAIKHRTDNIAVFAEGEGDCITKTYNFVNPMSQAHLMVKHPIVKDTEVKAYVSLRAKPVTVTGELLAAGNGNQQTCTLKNATKVASHGFALYFDGAKQTSGYAFSSTDAHVTFAAPSGVAVTADYIYNWEKEAFVEMTHDAVYPDKDDNTMVDDQFNYIKVAETDPSGAVSAIKVTLTQLTGKVDNLALGIGTGALQSFKLDHHAKVETIAITPVTATWSFKPQTDVLFVTAPAGEAIKLSYDWAAETNYLESLACIWNM